MSIKELRAEIKESLTGIRGLKVYDVIPESPSAPCIFFKPSGADYHMTASADSYTLRLEAILLLARGGDFEHAQNNLDKYLVPTGSDSIKAAIEGYAYENCDSMFVSGFRDYGGFVFSGETYIGCALDIEALI